MEAVQIPFERRARRRVPVLNFHTGNALFWTATYILGIPANYAALHGSPLAFVTNFFTVTKGFLLCYALRRIYRHLTSAPRHVAALVFATGLASICAGTVWSVGSFLTSWALLGHEFRTSDQWLDVFQMGLPTMTFVFLGWSGLYIGTIYLNAAAQARVEVVEKEASRLRHQVSPHLLLNALTPIRRDLETTGARSSEKFDVLVDYLHYALAEPRPDGVCIANEIEGAEAYLALVAPRFNGRLRWTLHAEPEALGTRCPDFILQPLVENAVKYGQPNDAGLLQIEVTAHVEEPHTIIRVFNTGHWRPATGTGGVGLPNLAQRLALWSNESRAAHLEAPSNEASDTGVSVVVRLTHKTQSHAEAQARRSIR